MSSVPPSFRTIFRSEKMVPKMSLASSFALSFPRRGTSPLLLDVGIQLLW